MASDQVEDKGSVISQFSTYLSDSVAELKKVSHPTRQETMQATIATLVIIFFVSICLFLLDLLFGRLMTSVLS